MLNTWPSPSRNRQRTVTVIHHPTASPSELISGTANDGVDLSPYVSRCQQSDRQAQITLNWQQALAGINQPAPGQWLALRINGKALWRGVIDAVSDYRESRGQWQLSLVVRSRDGQNLWRGPKRVTPVFPAGTTFDSIAGAVASAVGLASNEYRLSGLGLTVVQQNMQLADLSAWAMLEQLLWPAGFEPWINASGMLTMISRDVQRPADRVIPKEELIAITGSRQTLGASRVRLKWLSPELAKSSQQDQPLAQTGFTAGFFKLEQNRDLYWSDDRRQRAENTYMKVVQSINSGLLPVGDEDYQELDEFHGKVTVTTSAWVPSLATASLAGLIAASEIPDGATLGSTIPVGRVVQATSEVAILLIMMSMGTGQYEIWGSPYDYIHPFNTTEAYVCNTPQYTESVVELESDLIMDEAHAQAVTQRELRYRAYASQSYGVDIVDDPNIEKGDILALHDGSRLYVTGYSRDLSRGASAVLKVTGFKVS